MTQKEQDYLKEYERTKSLNSEELQKEADLHFKNEIDSSYANYIKQMEK